MEISTKLSIGDAMYYLYKNKPCKSTVTSINIVVTECEVYIKYGTDSSPKYVGNANAFKTKEELIEVLNSIII